MARKGVFWDEKSAGMLWGEVRGLLGYGWEKVLLVAKQNQKMGRCEMSERLKCNHCDGHGTANHHCCVAKAGFRPSNWMCSPYVVCCACKGTGFEPKASPLYNM